MVKTTAASKKKWPKAKDIADWTTEEKLKAYKNDPYLENYMLQKVFVQKLFRLIGWDATMDACSDPEGKNAHAPKWCSADKSAFTVDMSKERVIFNPPFQMAGEFIDYFERTKRR